MTIGFFAPLPLAIMIPFMAAQSFAMGEAFGKSFQYGKRKISSMSNDEFNKLDAEALQASIQVDIRKMIPSIKESFDRMESFQSDTINSLIKGIIQTVENIGGAFTPSSSTTTGGVASFLGGLPSVGNPIGDTLEQIAKFISGGFQAGNNPAASYQAILKQLKSQNLSNQIRNTTTAVLRTPQPIPIYNEYNPLRESRTTQSKSAIIAAKAKEKTQILTNIGTLNSQIHNQ